VMGMLMEEFKEHIEALKAKGLDTGPLERKIDNFDFYAERLRERIEACDPLTAFIDVAQVTAFEEKIRMDLTELYFGREIDYGDYMDLQKLVRDKYAEILRESARIFEERCIAKK